MHQETADYSMKHTLLFLLLLCAFSLGAQTYSMKKYDIGTTGCQVYLYAEPAFEMTYAEDSSEVWTGEIEKEEFFYSVICVRFHDNMQSDEQGLTDLLKSYLDFLQGQFGITGAAGYGAGQRLGERTDIYGVLDYWEDAESVQYNVMGWANNEYLAVLLVYGATEPDYTLSNNFFQGMRFPE